MLPPKPSYPLPKVVWDQGRSHKIRDSMVRLIGLLWARWWSGGIGLGTGRPSQEFFFSFFLFCVDGFLPEVRRDADGRKEEGRKILRGLSMRGWSQRPRRGRVSITPDPPGWEDSGTTLEDVVGFDGIEDRKVRSSASLNLRLLLSRRLGFLLLTYISLGN